MEKLSAEKSENISETLFSQYGNTVSFSLSKKMYMPKTLSAHISYLSKINDIENDLTGVCFGFENVLLNDELSNSKVRYIAQELACAIDKNDVQSIKEIKGLYAKYKEFAVAKEFLNQKCKEIWNVFENKNQKLQIPKEALQTLGITNVPTLEFLLADSLRFYEKDNGNTTSRIISSVLANVNISYDISDIHNFLMTFLKKEKCKLNFQTVKYLIVKQNYTHLKLEDLCVENNTVKNVFGELSLKEKSNFIFRNVKLKFLFKK